MLKKYERNPPAVVATILAGIGVLFSGFLTIEKLFTGSCTISEGCTSVFGIPSCVYGLVLFLIILITGILTLFRRKRGRGVRKILLLIASFIGVVFSLAVTLTELKPCPGGCTFTLFLPACAYGFVLFLAILTLVLTNK
ncbi:MAG: hypothetical protein V1725_04765 [archaeon]